VAVGAEEGEVLEPVVVAFAVDVVETERVLAPSIYPALLAAVLLQARSYKAFFEVVA
jgi:hypothetical protein